MTAPPTCTYDAERGNVAEAREVAACAPRTLEVDPSYTGVVSRPKLNDPMGAK